MNSQSNRQSNCEQGDESSCNVAMMDTDPQDGMVQPPPPCAVIPTSMIQMDSTNSYVLLSHDFAPIARNVMTTTSTSIGKNTKMQIKQHIRAKQAAIQPLIHAGGSRLTTGQSSLAITSLVNTRGTCQQPIPTLELPPSSTPRQYVLGTQLYTTMSDTKMIDYLKQGNNHQAPVSVSEPYSQYVEKFKVDSFRCLVKQLENTGPASRKPGDWCVSDVMSKLAPFKVDSNELKRIREACSHRESDVILELLCHLYLQICIGEISGAFLDYYWEAVLVCGQIPMYRPDDMTARRACPVQELPSQLTNISCTGDSSRK